MQDAECLNMHCVEKDAMGNGVCCDTACTTTCTSCKLAATRGKCTLVPAGGDPRMQCPAAMGAQAACIPGGCDGNTATCKIAPVTTQCRAPACAAGTQSAKTNCAADGSCPTATTTPCDPFACGATACKTTCAVDADCQTGGCLSGKCATFGGIYQVAGSPPCAQMCQDVNVFAGNTCACPAAFTAATLSGYVDCPTATFAPTTMSFCQRPTRTTLSDWGGSYATYAPGCGVNTTNPYTGAASCPADTVPTSYVFYETPCNQTSTITLCTSMTAPTTSYAGAYEIDDDALCRVTNPKTGACTCPAGTDPTPLRVLVNRGGAFGSHIEICVP
jgi:hypothetical protein